MTRDELVSKYHRRKAEFAKVNAQVDGAVICGEILSDLELLWVAEAEEVLTLDQAAERSGYSKEHLARMVRQGKIRDSRPPGSKGRIFVRAADLPLRPPQYHNRTTDAHELASRLFGGREA